MIITCPKCSAQYQIPDGVRISNGKKMKCSACQHVFVWQGEEPVSETPESAEDIPLQVNIDPVEEDQDQTETVFAEDDVFKAEEVPQPFVPVAQAIPEEKRSLGLVTALISLAILVLLVGAGLFYRDAIKKWALIGTEKTQQAQELTVSSVSSTNKTHEENRARPVERYVVETPQVVILPQIQSVRFETRQDVDLEVRIEGMLKNPTSQQIILPEKVRAFAYDAQGKVLFEKEIYLTDKVLPAGETLSFFGTYQPAPEGVQWVDVTF